MSKTLSEKDPDHYELMANIPTLNTKAGLFVPELGELFMGVVQSGGKSAEGTMYEAE